MLFRKTLSSLVATLLIGGISLPVAANKTNDLVQSCAQEQLNAHQGMKKPLSIKDFQAYCSCQANTVKEILTSSQLDVLIKNGFSSKEDWSIKAQKKVEDVCLNSPPKITT